LRERERKKFARAVESLAESPKSNSPLRVPENCEKVAFEFLKAQYPEYEWSRKPNLLAAGPDNIGQHRTRPGDFIVDETKQGKIGAANPARHLRNTGAGVQGSSEYISKLRRRKIR
jgi:hypothetical protein